MELNRSQAPGWPGSQPEGISSAKLGIGAALSRATRCWFTIGEGILNEIYYPHLDEVATRDMGLVVTDGREFFSEEKRDCRHEICYLVEGVPAYHLVNTCRSGRYQISKRVIADPEHDAVLQWTRFEPLQGKLADFRLYALLAPHLANQGGQVTAWIEEMYGTPMLLASGGGVCAAFGCSADWANTSVGFVGVSDGWQDLNRNRQLTRCYQRADNGNVAMTGEIDLTATRGEFVLAIGFGPSPVEAAESVRDALRESFENTRSMYVRQWQAWQQTLLPLDAYPQGRLNLYRTSTMVLRTQESLHNPGGIVASLSVPWGRARGDREAGGYHAVWPRDLTQASGGLLAAGARQDVRRTFLWLEKTQRPDGHWAQSMWMNGSPLQEPAQMDETALPILLLDLARRQEALDEAELERLWPMARRAAKYLVLHGPTTEEDRWEHDTGMTPFTIATQVAALLAAAQLADVVHQPEAGRYLRQTADSWNACIEQWLYVTNTQLARSVGVEGYYARIAPLRLVASTAPLPGEDANFNRLLSESGTPEAEVISPDALSLVRFGLRDAHDPRIENTVKVIDAVLKMNTPLGPCWHRYNGDTYGEHDDGSPYDGNGRGRAWPLLTGERAHYELAAGRRSEAEALLETMAAFANQGGMLPEQIWDAADIPEKNLFFARPTGSAMPLAWAHAEYVKLRRSLHDGWVFDMPLQTAQRYLGRRPVATHAVWRFDRPCRVVPEGVVLRLEFLAPGVVHFSTDDWQTSHDLETFDTGFGLYVADLPTDQLAVDNTVVFSVYWPAVKRWEGKNFTVQLGPPAAGRQVRGRTSGRGEKRG